MKNSIQRYEKQYFFREGSEIISSYKEIYTMIAGFAKISQLYYTSNMQDMLTYLSVPRCFIEFMEIRGLYRDAALKSL